jgi:glycosyltransferase involved in cell wall biosynthesis
MHQAIARFRGKACPLGLSSTIALNDKIPVPSPDSATYQACDGEMRSLGRRFLLLVARMNQCERYKGHYPLLRVMPEILKRYPDTQLVFPGPGDDREHITAFAVSQGVDSQVFVPGFLSYEELNALYRDCYAYVMPSTCEGFGVVHLEAMNSGKPCVGCFDDGAEDVIVHEETGYLLRDPDDAGALYAVLDRLLSDSEHAKRLGEAGFDRLHRQFTAAQFQKRFRSDISRYFP